MSKRKDRLVSPPLGQVRSSKPPKRSKEELAKLGKTWKIDAKNARRKELSSTEHLFINLERMVLNPQGTVAYFTGDVAKCWPMIPGARDISKAPRDEQHHNLVCKAYIFDNQYQPSFILKVLKTLPIIDPETTTITLNDFRQEATPMYVEYKIRINPSGTDFKRTNWPTFDKLPTSFTMAHVNNGGATWNFDDPINDDAYPIETFKQFPRTENPEGLIIRYATSAHVPGIPLLLRVLFLEYSEKNSFLTPVHSAVFEGWNRIRQVVAFQSQGTALGHLFNKKELLPPTKFLRIELSDLGTFLLASRIGKRTTMFDEKAMQMDFAETTYALGSAVYIRELQEYAYRGAYRVLNNVGAVPYEMMLTNRRKWFEAELRKRKRAGLL